MTIFGTPGGTTLNTSPFQGTAPGNAVQATLQPVNPGVGLFPPNSNNSSGDTVLASVARGATPFNALATNTGNKSSAPGRTITEAMSDGDRNGHNSSLGIDQLNSDANGGNSFGAGGANQTEGPTSGIGSQVSGANQSAAPTFGAPMQYQG